MNNIWVWGPEKRKILIVPASILIFMEDKVLLNKILPNFIIIIYWKKEWFSLFKNCKMYSPLACCNLGTKYISMKLKLFNYFIAAAVLFLIITSNRKFSVFMTLDLQYHYNVMYQGYQR